MTTITWGLLQKSGVDSETIEQAIVRLIAAHNAASTSHLAAGQSLEAHKNSTILDHLEGSVLIDKIEKSGVNVATGFENLAGFSYLGSVVREGWPGVLLGQDDDTPYKSRIDNLGSNVRSFVDFSHNFNIQFSFFLSEEGAGLGHFWFGNVTEISTGTFTYGVALELAPFGDKVRWKSAGHDIYVNISAVSRAEWHTCRIRFDTVLNTLYFYIDDVQVASMANVYSVSGPVGNVFMFYLDNTTPDGDDLRSTLNIEYLLINRR